MPCAKFEKFSGKDSLVTHPQNNTQTVAPMVQNAHIQIRGSSAYEDKSNDSGIGSNKSKAYARAILYRLSRLRDWTILADGFLGLRIGTLYILMW